MTSDRENRSGKRHYVKPAVTRVELVPEEAVLGNCRTTTRSSRVDLGDGCRNIGNACLYGTSAAQATPQRQ